jgi:molecular chaperone DnaJ
MATAERDYYELLGLGRNATEAEIKKAFRRLARELHPDVSEAPDAHERFREVAEAYEVLSNAETRELYDRYGHAGLRRGGFTPSDVDFGHLSDIFAAFFGDDLFGASTRQRRARGGDVGTAVEIELAEAFTGVKKKLSVEVADTCPACAGDGAEPGTGRTTCSGCGGAGRLQQVSRSVFGEFVRTQACPRCGGAGSVVEQPCKGCAGAGRTVEERALSVEIPAGIHDGQRIRIRGEGHAGRGGPPGDVFVEVRVRPHPLLLRDGDDIVTAVDLTIAQAALGARLTVPTLDGEAELELPPGTQPGEVRVLRGRGMPSLQSRGRGDQRVHVNVLVPRRLSEEQRRLLEEFERATGDEAYRPDEGFFDRLRSAFS